MVRPERRTKADLAAVAVLVLLVLAGAVMVWRHSDAVETVSETAPVPARPDSPAAVPTGLSEVWREPSPATPEPVVAGPVVVTAGGSEVVGRAPDSGEVRWRYQRNIPLCTVGSEWNRAVAVFAKEHNCSEVTSLRGTTGARGPQRNTDAEFGTRLLSDGTYLTATGHSIVESWRSDLVRTQQYGVPTAPKNPANKLTRPHCRYSSVAVGQERVGVIERCPHERTPRLTSIKARPEDDEEPDEVFSTLLGGQDANVVAVSETRAAAVLRDRSELVVYTKAASPRGTFPVRLGPGPTGEVRHEATANGGQVILWHTGRDTIALASDSFRPLWTIPDTLGPGTLFGGRLLVPRPAGLAVADPKTGHVERTIPVDRGDYRGPVQLSSVGDVVLERRGDLTVALRSSSGPPAQREGE